MTPYDVALKAPTAYPVDIGAGTQQEGTTMDFVRALFSAAPLPCAVLLVVLLALLTVAIAVTGFLVVRDVVVDPGGHWTMDWATGGRPRS
jgi:hypothetical protein